MRVAINGCGVAGTALAWRLKRYGFEPVIFEQAEALCTGGYMIDLWGPGYEVVEKPMSISLRNAAVVSTTDFSVCYDAISPRPYSTIVRILRLTLAKALLILTRTPTK